VAILSVTVVIGLGLVTGTVLNLRPAGDDQSPTGWVTLPTPTGGPASSSDAELARLFETQQSNVEVQGVGSVTRLLADDNDGSRHQRFILRLDSGQTLLVAHNIDLSGRLEALAVGDRVGFRGEYVYTPQGGTLHWTHHDPRGSHPGGWLEWNGKRYS